MFIQLIAGKTIEEQIEELKEEIKKKKKIIQEIKGESNNFLKEKNNDKPKEEAINKVDLDKRIERLEQLVNILFNKQNIPIGNDSSKQKETINIDNINDTKKNEPRFKEKEAEKTVDNIFSVNDDIHNFDDDELEKFIRSTKISPGLKKTNLPPTPTEIKKSSEATGVSIFKEP